jgi:hypothetical protein
MMECVNREDTLARSGRGPANVLGSARCAWADLAASPYQQAPTIAANVAGCFAPRLLHWVSMHREIFPACMPLRRLTLSEDHKNRLGRGPVITHAWRKHGELVDFVWLSEIVPDTSGCLAAMLALHFGYDPIVLCGVPLDDAGRFHAPHDERRSYPPANGTWAWLQREHGPRLRSMSGRTRELFGAP